MSDIGDDDDMFDGEYGDYGDVYDEEMGAGTEGGRGGGGGGYMDSSSRFSSGGETNTQIGMAMYAPLMNPNVPMEASPARSVASSRSRSSRSSASVSPSGGGGRYRDRDRDIHAGSRRRERDRSHSRASRDSRMSRGSRESRVSRVRDDARMRTPYPMPNIPGLPPVPNNMAAVRSPTADVTQRNDFATYYNEQYYGELMASQEEREMDERITLITQYMRLVERMEAEKTLSVPSKLSNEYVMPGVRRFSDEQLETIPLSRLKFTVYRLKRVRRLDTGVHQYKEWIVSGADWIETLLPRVAGLFLPPDLQPQLHGLSQRMEVVLRKGDFDDELEVLYHRNAGTGPSNPYWALGIGLCLLVARTHMDNYRSGNVKDHAFDMRDGFGTIRKLMNLVSNLFGGSSGGGASANPLGMFMNMFAGAGGGAGGAGGAMQNNADDEDEGALPPGGPGFKSADEAAAVLEASLRQLDA